MDVAKSDFSQMRRSDLGLIKNAERFARIDLDRSRYEKECNHCWNRKQKCESELISNCIEVRYKEVDIEASKPASSR